MDFGSITPFATNAEGFIQAHARPPQAGQQSGNTSLQTSSPTSFEEHLRTLPLRGSGADASPTEHDRSVRHNQLGHSNWWPPQFDRFSSPRHSVDIPRTGLGGPTGRPSQSNLRNNMFSCTRCTSPLAARQKNTAAPPTPLANVSHWVRDTESVPDKRQ